jgi:acyl-CoA thioester hydrolase
MQKKAPFSHNIQVSEDDIDDLGHVNNVVYVRWIQEVAAAHWEQAAPSALKAKYAWVVLRHEIDYRHPGFMSDNITGLTWVGEHNGARFDRFVQIQSAGRVLAEAKTTWCLLDAKTFKPIRIPADVLELL